MAHFERALALIPTDRRRTLTSTATRRRALSDLFYFLGVSLRKTGMRNRAVGSWVESARFWKRGIARRKLSRVTNSYGMARQETSIADDQQAFYGVQLARYVRSKQSHRLGTRAEIDMIAELIDEYWARIRSSLDISGMTAAQKMRVFRETVIVFPFLSVPDALKTEDVAVDFCHGTRVGPADRCPCGSGLPYRMCHGRTPGTDEALIGKF
ncbi:MAG: YecA family protein [Spirochaetota bacterium]